MDRTDLAFASGADRCAAWLYRPDGAGEGPVPCVVMGHGFSATREEGLAPFAERFAAHGMAALVFDYRHFGDSEGRPRQLLDIGRQLDDWRAAIACARRLEGVDPDRIALFGSSFSGGHVIETASRDHRIAAAIAQVPFCDGLAQLRGLPPRNALRLTLAGLRDQLAALFGRGPVTVPAIGPPGSLATMSQAEAEPGFRSIVGERSKWRNAVAARIALRIGLYRPGRRAGEVRCPLLVIVGERDTVTPPGPAIEAARRAPRGELVRYPIGHFEVYTSARAQALADQVAFLERALRPAAAKPALA